MMACSARFRSRLEPSQGPNLRKMSIEDCTFFTHLSDDRRVTEPDEDYDIRLDLWKYGSNFPVHCAATNIKVGSIRIVKSKQELSEATVKGRIPIDDVQEELAVFMLAAEKSILESKCLPAASNDSYATFPDVAYQALKEEESNKSFLNGVVTRFRKRSDKSRIKQFLTDVWPLATKTPRMHILKVFWKDLKIWAVSMYKTTTKIKEWIEHLGRCVPSPRCSEGRRTKDKRQGERKTITKARKKENRKKSSKEEAFLRNVTCVLVEPEITQCVVFN